MRFFKWLVIAATLCVTQGATAQWENQYYGTDTMAVSKTVKPNTKIPEDIEATIVVDCVIPVIVFSKPSQLDAWLSGPDAHLVYVYAKIDGRGELKRWSGRYDFDSNGLFFGENHDMVRSLGLGTKINITVPFSKYGDVEFEWTLLGSFKAMKNSCDQ